MNRRQRTRIKISAAGVRRVTSTYDDPGLDTNLGGESDVGREERTPGADSDSTTDSASSSISDKGVQKGSSTPLSVDLDENLAYFKSILGQAPDIVIQEFQIVDHNRAAIIYVDGLTDTKQVDQDILKPILQPQSAEEQMWRYRPNTYTGESPWQSPLQSPWETVVETDRTREVLVRTPLEPRPLAGLTIEQLKERFVTISHRKVTHTKQATLAAILEDTMVVLLINGEAKALALDAVGGEDRAIEEPATEAVIRGPREGFNENLGTSLSLIRRRLRTADLKIEAFTIGLRTKTKVAVCYLEGVASPNSVEELRIRLNRIDTDSIIDSGYIEEFIEDNPHSPFPQVQNTERPDVVAALILEGRIGIITDGSPFALIVPIDLWGALQASEDYYERHLISNAMRWLRFLYLFLNLYLPSMYVALTTFHQEMLPSKMLLSIAAAREVTPFPAVVEALIMEVTFEALREAGIRLPKAVGSAISIVGALVIGQAAVQAGIVSAPMVIVVSLTGIASFVIPRYNFAIAIRMLRFPMILLAGTLGMFGVIIGTLAIVIHLCGLRSLGMPYLSPVTPFSPNGMKDVFIRAPRWAMRSRPMETSKENVQRQSDAMRPKQRIPARQRPQS